VTGSPVSDCSSLATHSPSPNASTLALCTEPQPTRCVSPEQLSFVTHSPSPNTFAQPSYHLSYRVSTTRWLLHLHQMPRRLRFAQSLSLLDAFRLSSCRLQTIRLHQTPLHSLPTISLTESQPTRWLLHEQSSLATHSPSQEFTFERRFHGA
jgi:hypothetical protein